MRCKYCWYEWTTQEIYQKCPHCGKYLVENEQFKSNARFIIVNDTFIQFLGGDKHVIIPDGVVKLGAGAFHGYNVETIYIPDGVVEIGNNCFNNCKSLKRVRVPKSVTSISDTAFKDTFGVKIITEKDSYAWNKFSKNTNTLEKNYEPTIDSTNGGTAQNGNINADNKVSMSNSSAKNIETDEKKQPGRPNNSTDVSNTKLQNTSDCKRTSGTPSFKSEYIHKPDTNPNADNTHENTNDSFTVDSLVSSIETKLMDVVSVEKSIKWSQLLKCKPGETPWKNIKSSFLSTQDKKSKKLITLIKNIHDQELLTHIAQETNITDVACAAIRNITNQDVLIHFLKDKRGEIRSAVIENLKDTRLIEQLALNDQNSSVRQKAVEYISDSTILRKISQIDTDESVRNSAFFRVATPAELKVHLLKSKNPSDKCHIGRIKTVDDLIDLVLLANCESIRVEASNKLPTSSPEGNLLKAASLFSYDISLDSVLCYYDAEDNCRKINPDFLHKVAEKHHDPCVRYLARGKNKEPARGNSFEEQMRSQTRSQREITMEKTAQNCDALLNYARSAIDQFKDACKNSANDGKRCCKFDYPMSDYLIPPNELSFYEKLLYRELKKNNITSATISISPVYERRYINGGYRKVRTGHSFQIYTSW